MKEMCASSDLHDPFTVEVEAFESVQNKLWPDTDTESDGVCLITV